jgi:hypothetical protein
MVTEEIYNYGKPMTVENQLLLIEKYEEWRRNRPKPRMIVTQNVFNCLVELGFIDEYGNVK